MPPLSYLFFNSFYLFLHKSHPCTTPHYTTPHHTRAVGEKESLEYRITELGTLIASMEGAARTHSQRTNR